MSLCRHSSFPINLHNDWSGLLLCNRVGILASCPRFSSILLRYAPFPFARGCSSMLVFTLDLHFIELMFLFIGSIDSPLLYVPCSVERFFFESSSMFIHSSNLLILCLKTNQVISTALTLVCSTVRFTCPLLIFEPVTYRLSHYVPSDSSLKFKFI